MQSKSVTCSYARVKKEKKKKKTALDLLGNREK